MGLDRVAIKLSDTGLTVEYQCYSILPIKTSRRLMMKHLYSYNSPLLPSIYLIRKHEPLPTSHSDCTYETRTYGDPRPQD
jgi:hypothetical protein